MKNRQRGFALTTALLLNPYVLLAIGLAVIGAIAYVYHSGYSSAETKYKKLLAEEHARLEMATANMNAAVDANHRLITDLSTIRSTYREQTEALATLRDMEKLAARNRERALAAVLASSTRNDLTINELRALVQRAPSKETNCAEVDALLSDIIARRVRQ